jgi:dTDP-4-amino-4,6-dideoxygalactose transaminase
MLQHAPRILDERRAYEARYRAELAELAELARPHAPPDGVLGNGYLSVFELTRHEHGRLAERLRADGISVGSVYPETISEQAPARNAVRASELSQSRAFCRRVINLPLYYGMTDERQRHVCAAFTAALRDEA